jgi:hypothetical protein
VGTGMLDETTKIIAAIIICLGGLFVIGLHSLEKIQNRLVDLCARVNLDHKHYVQPILSECNKQIKLLQDDRAIERLSKRLPGDINKRYEEFFKKDGIENEKKI